jgi:hypothetical protein
MEVQVIIPKALIGSKSNFAKLEERSGPFLLEE